jgi:hypothetical protein
MGMGSVVRPAITRLNERVLLALGELRDEAVRRRYGVAYLFTRASLVLFPAAATMAHMELREAQAAERHVFDEAAKAVD